MQQSALGGDGVELLGYRFDAPDRLDRVLLTHVVGNRGRGDEQTGAGLTESLEQGAVFKFSDDTRVQALGFKPADEVGPQRDVFSRQQKRRPVQQRGKGSRQRLRQFRRGEHRQIALAEKVAVAPDVEVGRHGPVGDHQIEMVDRQFRQQRLQPVLAADEPHRFGEMQRRLDHAIGDRFRHRASDTDPKRLAFPRRLIHGDLQQFVAEREDFIGITEDAAPHVGQFQTAPDPAKQFHAETGFQFAQLAADGLWGQVQALAGAGDAAGLGDHPEIAQVLEVEAGHYSETIKAVLSAILVVFARLPVVADHP